MPEVDFDYPPTETLVLGDALEEYEAAAPDEAVDPETADEARAVTFAEGLSWAVDEFGTDAEIVLEGFTAGTRAQVVDRLTNDRVGDIGQRLTTNWMIAAAIVECPWFDDEVPLEDMVTAVAQLPPAVVDWLDHELEELNDLGNR